MADAKKLPLVADLKIINFRLLSDARGTLVPVELPSFIPFTPVRLFWITDAPPNTTRGEHGHKQCTQFCICTSGAVTLQCFDGEKELQLELKPGQSLLIPPLVYSSEIYRDAGSMLLVLCDRPYEADDYLHSREELIERRALFSRSS